MRRTWRDDWLGACFAVSGSAVSCVTQLWSAAAPRPTTLAPAPASAVAPIALALALEEAEAAQVVVMLALDVAPPNARKAPVAAAATRRRYVPEPPSTRVVLSVSNLLLMRLRPPRVKLEVPAPPAAAAGTLASAEPRVTR